MTQHDENPAGPIASAQSENDREREVRRLSEFRESIIRTAAEGICVCFGKQEFPHVEFSVWNDRMIEITGYTMEEINRLGWYQTLYPDPDYQQKARDRMDRMREGFDLRNEEWTITRKGGEQRIVGISTSIVEIEAGLFAVAALMQDVTEQHRVQKALKESQERLQLAIDASKLAPWDWDLRTNDVYFSREWKQQLGYEEDEIEGTYADWESRLHPDDKDAVLAQLKSYLAGEQEEYELEFRMRHKDGSYRWIYTRGDVQQDDDGIPIRMLGCHVDVTDRKNTEDTLRQILQSVSSTTGREYFSKLAKFLCESCGVDLALIAEVDAKNQSHATSIALYQDGSYQKELSYELSGTPCENVWEHQGSVCHYQDVQKLFPDDELLKQLNVQHYIGTPLWASSGEPIGLIALMSRRPPEAQERALSLLQVLGARSGAELERSRAEAAVDSSEKLLRSVTATVPHSLYVFNVQAQQTEYQNRYLASELGYTREELASMQPSVLAQLLHPDDLKRTPALLERWDTAADGEVLETEYRMRRKDGSWRWFLGRDTVYERDAQGKVKSIIGTAQDITHRVEAEKQRREFEAKIRHSQKLESLGVLAGGIAHDFNNLLTSILGFADLALMALPADSHASSYLQEVINGAQSAAELTGQMLAYSGKGKFTSETFDLSKVVSETSRLLEVSVSKKHTLKLDLDPDLPRCEGDMGQLRQVIMNLILNASEAIGDEHGDIAVSTSSVMQEAELVCPLTSKTLPSGQYVCLCVADNGCGMPKETQAKLFDPFFSTKLSGRGLGMSAVLGIVRGHQGRIVVDSTVGKGTTFQIFLPASSLNRPADGVAHEEDTKGFDPGAVLVADDEASILHSTSAVLKSLGFEVVTASNGKEAIEQFENRPDGIRLALLDLTMPEYDGAQVCQLIRDTRPDLPVILMSGYSEEAAGERIANDVQTAFLKKPFRIDELKKLLAQVSS